MNKKEFLTVLSETYDDFTEKNMLARFKVYNMVLSEIEKNCKRYNKEVNYGELFEEIVKNYDGLRYAPSPAYILKLAKNSNGDGYNAYL